MVGNPAAAAAAASAARKSRAGSSRSGAVVERDLLDLHGGAGRLELRLDLGGLVLGDRLLDRLRRRLDQVLGLLQAQAGDRADLLDDVDLLRAERRSGSRRTRSAPRPPRPEPPQRRRQRPPPRPGPPPRRPTSPRASSRAAPPRGRSGPRGPRPADPNSPSQPLPQRTLAMAPADPGAATFTARSGARLLRPCRQHAGDLTAWRLQQADEPAGRRVQQPDQLGAQLVERRQLRQGPHRGRVEQRAAQAAADDLQLVVLLAELADDLRRRRRVASRTRSPSGP